MTNLLVLAKAPIAGRVKTRLCPPLSPEEAAEVAGAALVDTLLAATSVRHARVVLVLDGPPGTWLEPFDVEVVPQRGAGLDERIAAAFDDVGGPSLLIGMDTPQVSASLLEQALVALAGHDAVIGPSRDGGYWALGLRRPQGDVVLGVPMSRADTGERQMARLRQANLDVALLPVLRDVDVIADAVEVARATPRLRFSRALATIMLHEAESAALRLVPDRAGS